MQRRMVVIALAALGVALGAAPARADKAAAEAAFLKGRQLMKDGKVAEACDAFAQSQALDPQLGTQYNLARCLEQVGRVASAWSAYREIAQRDTRPDRRADAQKRADALAPRLSRVLLRVTTAVPGLVITRDGLDVTAAVGIDTPVDPGEHVVEASAPGHRPWSTKVAVLREGVIETVWIPTLETLTATATTAEPGRVDPPEDGSVDDSGDEPDEPRSRPGSGRRILGLSIGGGGLVLVGAGAVAGLLARAEWKASEALCGTDGRCDDPADLAEANGHVSRARLRGHLATGLVGAGAAALVTGAILWWTAPSSTETAERTGLRIEPVVGRDRFLVSGQVEF